MTKNNQDNGLVKRLWNKIKCPVLAATAGLAFALYSGNAEAQRFVTGSKVTLETQRGKLKTGEVVRIHDVDYFSVRDNTKNDLGYNLWVADACDRKTSGKGTTVFTPNIVLTAKHAKDEEGNNAGRIYLSQTGNFAITGQILDSLKETSKNNTLDVIKIKSKGLTQEMARLEMDGKEYFAVYRDPAKNSEVKQGQEANFYIMPVRDKNCNFYDDITSHDGVVSIANADDVYKLVIDTAESNGDFLDANTLRKFLLKQGYPTADSIPTGEAEKIEVYEGKGTKEKRPKQSRCGSPVRASLGGNGYLGGLENQTSGASGESTFQFVFPSGFAAGFYGTHTPEQFKSISTNQYDLGTEKFVINSTPGFERYIISDTTGAETTTQYIPFNAGLKFSIPVSTNGELFIKAGAAQYEQTKEVEGTRTNTSYFQGVQDGASEVLFTEDPIVWETQSIVPAGGIGYQHYFGRNNRVSVTGEVGFTQTPDKNIDVTGNIGVHYTVGGRKCN